MLIGINMWDYRVRSMSDVVRYGNSFVSQIGRR